MTRSSNHALDERVILVRLQQFLKSCLVIPRIECDIALQVGKELRLLRIGSLVENLLRRSDVLLCVGLIPTPGGDTRLRVFPTKLPKVLARRFDFGFFQSGIVAYLILVIGGVQIARVNASASSLVGNL